MCRCTYVFESAHTSSGRLVFHIANGIMSSFLVFEGGDVYMYLFVYAGATTNHLAHWCSTSQIDYYGYFLGIFSHQ